MNTRTSYEVQAEVMGRLDYTPELGRLSTILRPLPGQNHDVMSFSDVVNFVPYYEMNEKGHLVVHDTVWGEEEIGKQEEDIVLLHLLHTPAMRRLMSVEQLTLPQGYETVPNSTEYKRFEHAWGSVVFVRKMIEKSPELQQLSGHEKMVLQLRTFLSDFGHTAFSHLGDWLKQGFGGPENAHDNRQELTRLLSLSGVSEVLGRHGYDLDEVIFPDVAGGGDWVECDQPKLCVDRVDFGVREILRVFTDDNGLMYRDINLKEILSIDKFEVVKGELVMNDWFSASIFSRLYSEIVLEHWLEPVHRGQLALFSELTRDALVSTDSISNPILNPHYLHPYDGLLSVDNEMMSNERIGRLQKQSFWRQVDFILRSTGLERRQWFHDYRRGQLLEYIIGVPALAGRGEQQAIAVDPVNITSGSVTRFSGHPPFVGILEVSEDDFYGKINPSKVKADYSATSDGLMVHLPKLKKRWIDPIVISDDRTAIMPLSRMGGYIDMFNGLVDAHLNRAFVIIYSMNRENATDIVRSVEDAQNRWIEAMKRPLLSDDKEFSTYLDHIGQQAMMSTFGAQMFNPNVFI